jgi:hypothetical protein
VDVLGRESLAQQETNLEFEILHIRSHSEQGPNVPYARYASEGDNWKCLNAVVSRSLQLLINWTPPSDLHPTGWGKRILIRWSPRTGGHVDNKFATPMCNEMQVPRIHWMLCDRKQVLCMCWCILFARYTKWARTAGARITLAGVFRHVGWSVFVAICNRNLGKLFIGVRFDGRTSHLFATRKILLLRFLQKKCGIPCATKREDT